jgi:hypothetical protein
MHQSISEAHHDANRMVQFPAGGNTARSRDSQDERDLPACSLSGDIRSMEAK